MVPWPVNELWPSWTVIPLGAVTVRVTCEAKPVPGDMTTLAVSDFPTWIDKLFVAVSEKSGGCDAFTVNSTVTVRVMPMLAAFTAMSYVPGLVAVKGRGDVAVPFETQLIPGW